MASTSARDASLEMGDAKDRGATTQQADEVEASPGGPLNVDAEAEKEVLDPVLIRFARSLGKGVADDLRGRAPHYADDWREVMRDRGRALARIVAASVYIFLASAIPAIAFGEQLKAETKGKMTLYQTLLSTGMCGVIQSLAGGQPLLIVGVAEPIVIIYHFMDEYCTRTGTDFTAWAAWTCVWATAFLVLMAVTNICNGIKWFTRFCGETFGMLIAVLFLQQAITGLVSEWDTGFFGDFFVPKYWRTLNGTFGLLLALLYIWSSYTLSQARSWRLGVSWFRAICADYGFAIMLAAISGLSFALKINPAVPQRLEVLPLTESVWLTEGIYTIRYMAGVGVGQIFAAIIPGFVISVLFYFDHSVSSQLAQQKDFRVKRPSAYHYDLLLLAVMTLLCGLLGIPPVNGVLPQAPLHTKALCAKVRIPRVESTGSMSGVSGGVESTGSSASKRFIVYENRVSNFVQATLCLVLFGVAEYILKFIPTSLVWAFFAFMALESLPGNQFWARVKFVISDPKRREGWESVDYLSVLIFTAIQAVCLLGIWAITVWSGLFGISFPLFIMALVPLRQFLLPKVLRPDFLEVLDADETVEFPTDPTEPDVLHGGMESGSHL